MSNGDLSGMVQTVVGPVRPEDLGPTTTHEHLLVDLICMFHPPSEATERFKAFQPLSLKNLAWASYDPFRNLDNLQLLSEEEAIFEASLYKRAGGGAIVDVTTIGMGRDPSALARIARATGLNIVMGAGYYVDASHPEGIDDKTDRDLAREMVEDITVGVGEHRVKAGIIGELGCTWPMTENERKVLRAGARAQRETGAAILIHPGRNEAAPAEILDLLAEAGADLGRVVMGHLDRTISEVDTVIELAGRGCYLEYDVFGWETSNYPLSEMDMPNDAVRIEHITRLIDAGLASRVVIAQDICFKQRLTTYGGHGYGHILTNIVPRMRQKGISEEDLHSILEANPARILAFV